MMKLHTLRRRTIGWMDGWTGGRKDWRRRMEDLGWRWMDGRE
jgi:hypothetical protein